MDAMLVLGQLDMSVFGAIYGGPEGPWAPLMVVLTVVGGGWLSLLLVPLLAWPRSRRVAQALTVAVVAQATWVWALKRVVGRVRPWIALGLPAPFGAPHDSSFPSGHASGCFCAVAFLSVVLPWAWPRRAAATLSVLAFAYAFAAAVAVSRVYLGCHFPSDVLAGAVMGSCFGSLTAGVFIGRRREHAAVTVRV